jgi:hypothetical protein
MSKSIVYYDECKQACPKFAHDFVNVLSNYTNKKIDLNPNIQTIIGHISNLNLIEENEIQDNCINFDCQYQLQGSDKKFSVSIQLYYKDGKLNREGGEPAVLIHEKYTLKYIERRLNGKRKNFQFI